MIISIGAFQLKWAQIMTLKNSKSGYGTLAKIFHWVMAVLIVFMFALMYYPGVVAMASFVKIDIYFIHKSTGVLLLALALLRFIWRLLNQSPSHSMPLWQIVLAKANFFLLYFLMFAMPISGIAGSITSGKPVPFYGLFSIGALERNADLSKIFWKGHELFSDVLIVCIMLHILGAFYHVLVVMKSGGRSIVTNLYNMKAE